MKQPLFILLFLLSVVILLADCSVPNAISPTEQPPTAINQTSTLAQGIKLATKGELSPTASVVSIPNMIKPWPSATEETTLLPYPYPTKTTRAMNEVIIPNSETQEAIIDWYRERAVITLENNGEVVTLNYKIGNRFAVFLDDEKYPVNSLIDGPGCPFGYVSNYSFRGPHNYPIGYEIVRAGQCVLRNGDFSVTIVVLVVTPVPPSANP